MATQQERLVDLLHRLELIEATYGREMPHIKREIADLIRFTRETPTMTLPAGILCAGPDVWHTPPDEEPIGHVEPVDSSAMIPADQIEAAARGGE
jgi:hypothetical protein